MEENSIVEENRFVRDNETPRIVGESGKLWERELRELSYGEYGKLWDRHRRTKRVMGEKELRERRNSTRDKRLWVRQGITEKEEELWDRNGVNGNKGIIEEKGELWEKGDDEKNSALWERQKIMAVKGELWE